MSARVAVAYESSRFQWACSYKCRDVAIKII